MSAGREEDRWSEARVSQEGLQVTVTWVKSSERLLKVTLRIQTRVPETPEHIASPPSKRAPYDSPLCAEGCQSWETSHTKYSSHTVKRLSHVEYTNALNDVDLRSFVSFQLTDGCTSEGGGNTEEDSDTPESSLSSALRNNPGDFESIISCLCTICGALLA